MKKIFFLFIFFILITIRPAFATHNRAGEITYTYISGFTYKITVTTYTSTAPITNADRCEVTVYFGDGDSATAPRINGPNILSCASGHDGVMITSAIKWN